MTQLKVYIDLDNDTNYDQDFEDVSTFVQTASWNLGRSNTLWDDPVPFQGKANFRLINNTRRWSPEYTGSTVGGSLLPGRRVRVDVVHNNGTATMWHGWIERVQVGAGRYTDPFVTLTCVQGFDFLERSTTNIPIQQAVGAGTIIAQAISEQVIGAGLQDYFILDSDDFGVLDSNALLDNSQQYNGDTGQTVFAYVGDKWNEGATSWNVVDQMVMAERGFIWQDRGGTVQFRDRHWLAKKTTNAGTININTSAVGAVHTSHEPYNIIRVTAYPREVAENVTTIWTYAEEVEIDPSESKEVTASFSNAEGVQIAALSIETPVANTDYFAEFGDGTSATDVLGISIDNQGARAIVSLSNFSTTQKITVTSIRLQGITLSSYDATTLEAIDANSIGTYGRRQKQIDLPLLDDAEEARGYAEFLLRQYKEPNQIIESLMIRGRSEWITTAIESWDFGTRVAVNEYQAGDDEHDYFIVGENWAYNGPGDIEGSFTLLRADTQSYFILDTSVVGGTDVIAY